MFNKMQIPSVMGKSNIIAILDGMHDNVPVTAKSPLSCSSFQIISTDIRTAVLAGYLSINGTTITSGEITQLWQSNGSFGGRVIVQHPISKGDTISFIATAGGSSTDHVGLVMFVEQ